MKNNNIRYILLTNEYIKIRIWLNGENPELNLGILSLFLISMSGGVLSTAEQPKPIIKEEVKNDRGCCKSSNWKDN